MKKQITKKGGDFDKPVTLGLMLEYTDEFLIPKIGEVVDEKINMSITKLEQNINEKINISHAKLEHNLKDYIDRKGSQYMTDAFQKMEKTFQKDKAYKEKLISLLKKYKIGTNTDWAYLDGLVVGGV